MTRPRAWSSLPLGGNVPTNSARMNANVKRDYSLIGRDSERAQEQGLVAAEWYHTDVPRASA